MERLTDEQIEKVRVQIRFRYGSLTLPTLVEMEQLISDLRHYKKALEEIKNFKGGEALVYVHKIKDIARQALEGDTP